MQAIESGPAERSGAADSGTAANGALGRQLLLPLLHDIFFSSSVM